MCGPIQRRRAEAWVDGHIHAFAFFGAVPQSIVYDNDRCLVAKILPNGRMRLLDREEEPA
jgi:transposase